MDLKIAVRPFNIGGIMLINNNISGVLPQYNLWANEIIFKAISDIPDQESNKNNDKSFGSMVQILNHNYIVGRIWQAHLEGHEHGYTERNPKEYPRLEALWQLQQKMDAWLIAYYDELSNDDLNQLVYFKLISGNDGYMTRLEILFHLINHTTYHRGFIADMFYQRSLTPPTTDLPIFLCQRDFKSY